jgi:hypothetical protein
VAVLPVFKYDGAAEDNEDTMSEASKDGKGTWSRDITAGNVINAPAHRQIIRFRRRELNANGGDKQWAATGGEQS